MGADQAEATAIHIDHVGAPDPRIRQVQAVGRPGGVKTRDGQHGQLALIGPVPIHDVRVDRCDAAIRGGPSRTKATLEPSGDHAGPVSVSFVAGAVSCRSSLPSGWIRRKVAWPATGATYTIALPSGDQSGCTPSARSRLDVPSRLRMYVCCYPLVNHDLAAVR